VLALAAGLTLLLAVVAVASRGDRASPARGGGPSETFWDYVLSTYLVVGALMFVALVYLLAKERESLPTRRTKHREIRQLLQLGVVVALLFVAGPYIWNALNPRGDERNQAAQTQPSGGSRVRGPDRPPEPPERRFRWAPAIALGVLGLVAVAAVATMRARRKELGGGEVADALADVLDDALADLRAERDPRRAIIAAYARMERLLAAHGVPRRPPEAPFEYLARVLVELRASASSVFELTALFERAKFSRHRIDAGMRDEAIAALAAVRDELRGPE
jgi:multisubunit Na+/H+ antiporter MnhB subunit